MPRDKRVRVLAWALARKEADLALWSVSPLQSTDVAHLLARVLAQPKGKPKDSIMGGILSQLLDDG